MGSLRAQRTSVLASAVTAGVLLASGAAGAAVAAPAAAPAPARPAAASSQTTAVRAASKPRPATPRRATCPRPQSIANLPVKGKRVALTFDDGPTNYTTRAILAVLAKEGVRATFFDQGVNAARYPQLERAVVAGGHVIGNHSWDHPQLTRLSRAAATRQIARTDQVITRATGRPVCFVRPPYGATNASVRSMLTARGQSQVLWNVDTLDWSRPGTNVIVRRATAVPNGRSAVVLMHATPSKDTADATTRNQTVQALPRIIREYKKRGYTFVQVDGTAFPRR